MTIDKQQQYNPYTYLGEGDSVRASRHPQLESRVILSELRPGIMSERQSSYIAAGKAAEIVNAEPGHNFSLRTPSFDLSRNRGELAVSKAGGIPLFLPDLLAEFQDMKFVRYIESLIPIKTRIEILRMYYQYIDALHIINPPYANLDPKASAIFLNPYANEVWIIDPPGKMASDRKRAIDDDFAVLTPQSLNLTLINPLLNPLGLDTLNQHVAECDLSNLPLMQELGSFSKSIRLEELALQEMQKITTRESRLLGQQFGIETKILAHNLTQPAKKLDRSVQDYRTRLYQTLGKYIHPKTGDLTEDIRSRTRPVKFLKVNNFPKTKKDRPFVGVYQVLPVNPDIKPLNYLVITLQGSHSQLKFDDRIITPSQVTAKTIDSTELWIGLGAHLDLCVQYCQDDNGRRLPDQRISILRNDVSTNLEIKSIVDNALGNND